MKYDAIQPHCRFRTSCADEVHSQNGRFVERTLPRFCVFTKLTEID